MNLDLIHALLIFMYLYFAYLLFLIEERKNASHICLMQFQWGLKCNKVVKGIIL